MNTPICKKLKELNRKKTVPFHMPGHKRKGQGPFPDAQARDITEITGYDDLHDPRGMIRESMDMLKSVYGTRESWYLVNGSTLGILASLLAVCDHGDSIIMGRNCHKSVYHAVRLLHLHPLYLFPEMDREYGICSGYDPEKIGEIIRKYPEVKAVILTSPTYEGVVADVRAVKSVLGGLPLIIDEAHGAHFIFDDYFPESAVNCGGDLVIQSTHKTLPSLTQTALLHLSSEVISREGIHQSLEILETSSPSYLLLASAEYGVAFMKEEVERLRRYVDNLKDFRRKCGQLSHIRLLENHDGKYYDYDRGKLVFYVRGRGKELFGRMREEHGIEMEMASLSYVIAMTSVWDDPEDYEYLWNALETEDRRMGQEEDKRRVNETSSESSFDTTFDEPDLVLPRKVYESWECERMKTQILPFEDAGGKISARDLMVYPPGIPFLVAGERICPEILEIMRRYLYNGFDIRGLNSDGIEVVKENPEDL